MIIVTRYIYCTAVKIYPFGLYEVTVNIKYTVFFKAYSIVLCKIAVDGHSTAADIYILIVYNISVYGEIAAVNINDSAACNSTVYYNCCSVKIKILIEKNISVYYCYLTDSLFGYYLTEYISLNLVICCRSRYCRYKRYSKSCKQCQCQYFSVKFLF